MTASFAPESRYSKGTAAWVEHPTQGRVEVVHLRPLIWSNYPYTRYQVTEADTLTSLAHRAYGNAADFWFIASMNPQVECPDDLVAGDVLRIPTGKLW